MKIRQLLGKIRRLLKCRDRLLSTCLLMLYQLKDINELMQ